MDRPETTTSAPPSEPDADVPGGVRRILAPYLAVAILGLLAALIVMAQLWAYRDELRTILTQTPV